MAFVIIYSVKIPDGVQMICRDAAKAQVPCEAKGARVFGMRPAGRSPAGLLDPPYLTGG